MMLNLKEAIWFFVPVVLSLLFIGGVGGFTESTLDINIHDTYYVITPMHLFVLLVPVLGFLIFAVRSCVYKFKNKGSNISLGIYTVALAFTIIVFTYGLSSILD